MSERHIQDGSGSGTPGCRTDTAVVSLLIWTAFGLVAVATLASPAQARQFRTASAAEEAEVPGGRTVDRSPLSKGEYTDCRPTTTPLVFDGGYRVSMCYETAQGRVGEAQAGIWASGQSGLLWFFDRDNAEVLVKVLDGCSSNRHRWVFVAPVTDVAFNLYVTSSGGREWTHRNPLGQTAVTRSDTSAFVCATDDDAARTSLATGEGPELATGQNVVASPLSKGEYTDCRPTTAPLVFDGTYQVSLCYETEAGVIGEARGGLWASTQSGLLWFFSRDNAEVLVKVLDGCSHNGSRWIFVAPVTDVAFNLHVTSVGGRKWEHRNRLGETAATRSDTSAFDCTTDDDPGEGGILTAVRDIEAFLDQCPTKDPVFADIRREFDVRFEGEPFSRPVVCEEPAAAMPSREVTYRLKAYQTLRLAYHMNDATRGRLPWTKMGLYEWVVSRVSGVNIKAAPGVFYCCDRIDGKLYFATSTSRLDSSGRVIQYKQGMDWMDISGTLPFYLHEIRHTDEDAPGHVTGCEPFPNPTDPPGCDATYDLSNLGGYGVWYWLMSSWATGYVDVGIACSPRADEHIDWLVNSANGQRARFVTNVPPLLTADSFEGLCVP